LLKPTRISAGICSGGCFECDFFIKEGTMTITGKLSIILSVLILAAVAQGSEFSIHPAIAVREEYNDNIFLTSSNKTNDFITEAMPSIELKYKAPILDLGINYTYDYIYYAKGSQGTDQTHNLNANAHLTMVENLLFLDVTDTYSRVSLDVTRNFSRDSLFVNQTDQNTLTVSPNVVLHPNQLMVVKAGYRFIDYRYIDSPGIDKTDHVGYLDASYEVSPNWFITWGYTFTRELGDDALDFNRHEPYAGFKYEYANKSFLFGQVGYTWISYDNGQKLNHIYWNAGFTHNLDPVTFTINTGVRYDEDPQSNITQETFVAASIDRQFEKGSMGLSAYYSEYDQPNTNSLQTRKYGGSIRGSYQFTSLLTGNLSFTAEKYDQPQQDSYSRYLSATAGLSYILFHDCTASLNYIYTDSYSPGITMDNYRVNRAMVEIRKVF